MAILFKAVLTAATLLLCYHTARAFLSLAPWVPMRKKDLPRAARLANIRPGETFFDLGAGDGRLVFHMAKTHPGSLAIGIELFWPAWLFAWLKNRLYGPANARFVWGDALAYGLGQADAVFLFAMPGSLTERLAAKLRSELRPGSRVITYTFAFPGWTPVSVDKPAENDLAIYLYYI
jgi:SAM-dependent methyltransferase